MTYQDFDLNARYELLNRAMNQDNTLDSEVQQSLHQLDYLVYHELVNLGQKTPTPNFAKLLFPLQEKFKQFKEFCEFPAITQKNIVAIGGKFSAGKSTFINNLLGKKRLAVEIDPTTSIPTYILKGEQNQIVGLNLFNRQVLFSQDEFATLTHEEKEKYGSQVGRLLKSVFITDPDFRWENLALLDTPGYTKPEDKQQSERTDADVAHAQLNSAQFIIWLVSAEDGGIKDDDLAFLASLNRNIPKLVLITKSDRKTPDEVKDIVHLTKKLLSNAGLAVKNVLPVSRKLADYPLDDVLAILDKVNDKNQKIINFGEYFNNLFDSIKQLIVKEKDKYQNLINQTNKLVMSDKISDTVAKINIDSYKSMMKDFDNITQELDKYFKKFCYHYDIVERYRQGRPKLPEGVIEHKFQSGKIAKLVEPTHELAKDLYERFYTSPPDNTVSEYWVELDENNKPIDYVKIYKGEVNVDRKRHETDQFFKAWMKNENKRDTDKTMKTLFMLQNSSLISEYEKMIELKLKEGIDSDEQLVETDQVIVLDGLYGCIEKINNKNILRDIVIDDFLEKNPDTKLTRNVLMNTPLNFNVVEFLKFNIPNSVDVQNALSIITAASTFGQVRDGLYALSCCISKHYVKELNTHITDWINKKCHRLFGSDRQFMDSFMADLEDANEYMESIGKLREFNSFVGELVANVLKPYKTTDKEIREIMDYPDDVEESIMFGFISNVTCIPVDSSEYYQQCDDMGRLLIGKDEFVGGLAFGKISSYALPNNSETVVVTSDGMNMFVTKIDDKTFILSRE